MTSTRRTYMRDVNKDVLLTAWERVLRYAGMLRSGKFSGHAVLQSCLEVAHGSSIISHLGLVS